MAAEPTMGRRERNRAEKQRRLLDAARELFAEQGVDATRINEITDRADVGFGSFYNYFADKDAIVEAVIRETTEAHGATVDRLTADVEDPAEVVAIAHRHFVRLAAEDPSWGQFALRLEASHRVITRTLGARALRDLEAGIASGRFRVADPQLAVSSAGGALLGTIQAIVDGRVHAANADILHAEGVLRLLGVPAAEAAKIAARPLPDY